MIHHRFTDKSQLLQPLLVQAHACMEQRVGVEVLRVPAAAEPLLLQAPFEQSKQSLLCLGCVTQDARCVHVATSQGSGVCLKGTWSHKPSGVGSKRLQTDFTANSP